MLRRFSTLGLYIGGAFLTLALGSGYFYKYFLDGYIAGWDGSSHYFLSIAYAHNGWPSLNVWLPNWFQGFWFPRFYPPLFYLALGFLYHAVPFISPVTLFKWFLVIPVLLIPGALVHFSLLFTKRAWVSWLTLLLASLQIIDCGKSFSLALGVNQALISGLSTQPLAALLLLWLLIVIFDSICQQRISIAIIPLSFLFFWSNYHVILIGSILMIFIFIAFIFDHRAVVLNVIGFILIGFLLASPWYVQVLIHRGESPGIPLHLTFAQTQHWIILFLCYLPAVIIHVLHTRTNPYWRRCLYCLLVATVVIFIPAYWFAKIMPWQPNRMANLLMLFYPLIFALAVEKAVEVKIRNLRWICLVYVALVPALILWDFEYPKDTLATISRKDSNLYQELFSWSTQNPPLGYVVTGMPQEYRRYANLVNAGVTSIPGNRGVWTVFRESSLNSIFMVPIRNMISSSTETFGIHIGVNQRLLQSWPWKEKLELSRWMGVSRFIYLSGDVPAMEQAIEQEHLPLKKVFQNSRVAVFDLDEIPILEFSSYKARFVVGPFQRGERRKSDLGLPWLAERLIEKGLYKEVVVAATSCAPMRRLSQSVGRELQIICLNHEESCCTVQAKSFEEVMDQSFVEQNLLVNIRNESARDLSSLFALPYRQVNIHVPEK